MDRILLDRKVDIGKEVMIKGPPLEALRFQGARAGSLVTLTDAEGKDFRGRVSSCSHEEASVLIFDVFPSSTESPLEVILLQALPERERMELIIQKATELGVSTIVPFKAERSISLQEREAKQKKAHRWQEIAVKAVRQSRRAKVPVVEPYRFFEEALEFCKEEGLKILLWEKEGERLKDVVRSGFSSTGSPVDHNRARHSRESGNPENHWIPGQARNDRLHETHAAMCGFIIPPLEKGGQGGFECCSPVKIYAMVGPEGGFSEEEARLAREKGFIPVKLGQRILRTETAAITLIGILQYELGDLG